MTSTTDSSSPILVGAALDSGSIRLSICGRDWTLLRPTDLESLWDAISDDAFGVDERLPYWVELWPASLALALWLQKKQARIAGRTCLDLGCGLGLTALIGAWLGAKVIGMDYEAEALAFARKNAGINAVPQPLWVVMDWRSPAVAARCCDFIWAGDIVYENRFVEPVFAFLDHALADDGLVWIAEPGRGTYDGFKRALFSRGWKSRSIARERVESLHVQKVPVTANLWELSR